MSTDKDTAKQKIQALLAQINELYSQCEEIAKEHTVGFSVDGPSYGMGGYFNPEEISEYSDTNWHASSHDC